MKSSQKKTICLVMLVKDEAAIIERCLKSVRDLIDTWLIIDTGSSDDTASRAQQQLNGIPGEWLSCPWQDFSTHRNQLLALSRDRADYSLWLDADETVAINPETPWPELTAPGYTIEVQTQRGSFMPIRLMRSDIDGRFAGPINEFLTHSSPLPAFKQVVIYHHEDGILWRDAARNKRDILRFETALLEEPEDPGLTLALAERYAACGELMTALHHYRRRAKMGGDEAQNWFALYQAARMLDESGFATPLVTEAYLSAYDLRPTKVEPLIHIARRCLQEGLYQTASDIASAAVSTPLEDYSYFFEPAVYHSERYLTYLRAALELGNHTEVLEYAEQLINQQELSLPTLQEVDALRNTALQHQAGGVHTTFVANPPAASAEPEIVRKIPEATPRRDKRKLCIGMSTYDDYDGVYFSIQAIRLFHAEVAEEIEILVIDNNPTGACGEALKELEHWADNYRYVPESNFRGTAARDLIFREANADYVLVLDCHVLLVPGALRRLLDYFKANPETTNLLQGPLLYDDLNNVSTHFDPIWRQGMYGTWGVDQRGLDPEAEAFDIPMQGLGLFACRRDIWPGFNSRFRGFGGEEGYIHEKFRQAGARALCLPFLRWTHRFQRPLGVPYAVNWVDRIRNYSIGHQELGLDPTPIVTHFNELIGVEETTPIRARIDNEMQSPLYEFDGIYYYRSLDSATTEQPLACSDVEQLGIKDRLITIDDIAIDGRNTPKLGKILALRKIIELAQRQNLQKILIIEEGGDLLRTISICGRDRLKELFLTDWRIYLFGSQQLKADSTLNFITAYHSSVFDRILGDIPSQKEAVEEWLTEQQSLRCYLQTIIEDAQ